MAGTALLGGRFALLPNLALAALAAASVPSALAVRGSSGPFGSGGMEPLLEGARSGISLLERHLGAAGEALRREYTGAAERGAQMGERETPEAIQSTWREGKTKLEGIERTVKDHGESINYYLFAAGNLVKSALKLTPTILRDTIVYASDTEKQQQLLSIQKIMGAAQMEGFGGFVSSLGKLLMQRSVTIDGLSLEDGVGVLRILRGVREDEFNTFMKQVKENIDTLDPGTHYAEAGELLKDVFVGGQAREEYKANLEELKRKFRELMGKIKSSDRFDAGEIMEAVEQLETFPKTKA